MNKKFLLIVAFISLNAGSALFADEGIADEQTEASDVAANETADATQEQTKEAAPQKGCGCPHAK